MNRRISRFSFTILLILIFAAPANARGKRGRLPSDLATEIHSVLQKATQSGDMIVRGTAYYGLGLAKPTGVDVTSALKFGLQDPQAKVRLGVVRGMIASNKKHYDVALVKLLGTPTLNWTDDILPVLHQLSANEAAQAIVNTLNAKGVKDKERIAQRALEALALDRVSWGKKTPSLLPTFFQRVASAKGEAGSFVSQALRKISPKASINVYPHALRHGTTEIRATTFENIERLPSGADLSFIRPLMSSSNLQVARGAAKLLATQGDASAVPLLWPLVHGDDVKERLEALEAIRHAANRSHLLELEPFRDPTARTPANVLFHVYGAYAHAGDRSIGPELRAALRGTKGDYRAAAVRWLADIEGTAALPDLIQFLKDGNPKVRENAAYAIGQLRTISALPALEDALWDPSPEVKAEVTRSIAKLKDNKIIDVIGPLIIEPNQAIQLQVIKTLTELKNASTVAYLLQGLSDSKQIVRVSALRGLMATDLNTAKKKFKEALRWLKPSDVEDIAREIKNDFVPYVRSAIGHRNPKIREAGINALEHINSKIRTQILESVGKSSRYPETRMGALGMLMNTRKGSLVPQLTAILVDGGATSTLKIEAIRLLAKSRQKGALDALRAALLEPTEIVRVEAAIGLLSLFR